ncbi:MAG TPA: hypothetical protein VJ785_15085 [Anaerolineales bacterium]|nr:hypothetical protein [Anaerolineales bacterium]
MKQFINRLVAIPTLAHEICHYIPAALFGLQPAIDSSWKKMRHAKTSGIKRLVILLSPAVIGLLGLTASLILTGGNFISSTFKRQIVLAAIYAFWFAWLAACRIDLHKAYTQLKVSEME